MGKNWRRNCIVALLTAVCLAGCAKPGEGEKEAAGMETDVDVSGTADVTDAENSAAVHAQETDGTVTVWLDAENEYVVRECAANYEAFVNEGSGVEWELVDKSSLTGEQYRREFDEAFAEGTAPDLIYMDRRNGLNPEELMEEGRLLGLTEEELLTGINGRAFSLIEGAQEAGERDGMYEVLPLYMECPVVFGLEGDLKEAGIETEGMYGSLEDFLKAALAAQEKTGKLIFENTGAVDWLEAYYLPEGAAEAEDVRALLEEVRGHCGDDASAYGAYRMLDAGECLLGGCGVADYKQMCACLSLFGEGQAPAALAIPDSGGAFRGVITHAVAVNAHTARPEEAKAALRAFTSSSFMEPDIFCEKRESDADLLFRSASYVAQGSLYKELAAKTGELPEGILDALEKYCFEEISAFSFAQEREQAAETDGHSHEGDAQTLCIHYNDYGDREGHPYAVWLRQAAEAYEAAHGGTHVQLTALHMLQPTLEINGQRMFRAGMGPGIELCGVSGVQPDTGVAASDLKSPDFAPLFEKYREETSFLPESLSEGVAYGNGVTALPVAAEEFGVWYSRGALEKAGLPEDWRPADMAELTEGLERLAGLSGDGKPYAAFVNDVDVIKAMAVFAAGSGELLKLQDDGAWSLSEPAWAEALSGMVKWREEGLAEPVGYGSDKEILERFADGSIGACIGGSGLRAWIDGDAAPLTEGQKADLAFVQLSPAADMQMFYVPAKSERAEDAFLFWLEAVRQPEYEALIKRCGYVPITELPDDVVSLPNEEGRWRDMEKLQQKLWASDMTGEELAEEYKWFRFAEE